MRMMLVLPVMGSYFAVFGCGYIVFTSVDCEHVLCLEAFKAT